VNPVAAEPVATRPPIAGGLRGAQRTFALLMAVASVLGLVKGVVFAKILGAQDLGSYGLVLLVSQFGLYVANWGVMSALSNQLPIALGRGEGDTDAFVDRSFGALILTCSITAAVYLAAVLALSPGDGDVLVALLAASVVTVVTTLCEFQFLLLRVHRQIVPLGQMYLLRAVVAIALGAVAGTIAGFVGVIIAELVVLALVVIVSRRAWLATVRVRRPRRIDLRWLIARGAPLMVANLLIIGTFTIDRVFVATTLPDEFGQYTFASFVVVGWLAITGVLNQAVAPQLLFEYGQGLPLRRVRMRALRLVARLAALGGAGLLVLAVLTAWAREAVLSDFAPGLTAMLILYVGGLVSVLALPGFLLHALRPAFSTAAAVLGAVVALVGGAVLAGGNPGINDFAWLFVASQLATTLAMLGGVEWVVRHPVVLRHMPG
jgi:O-antigen/teichoic acid export membrane protein